MGNLKLICNGVYEATGESKPQAMTYQGECLYRFMDMFYINCEADELGPLQVEALCRARACNPASFSGANFKVRNIFRAFIDKTEPKNILEVGAGTNPILHEHDLIAEQINYVRSDADPINADKKNIFSGTEDTLNHPDAYFDVIAAVFVLHFRFYEEQISEIYRCLKQEGVFVANVYRRTEQSRENLRGQFLRCGFVLLMLDDPSNLCQDHQYWIAGKEQSRVDAAATLLRSLILAS